MGQVAYRANLSASIYPMTISEGGRTVIMPGPDQNFDRRVDPTGAQKDAGIPQALYLENVMPTASGYQSVGYGTPTSPMTLAPSEFILNSIEVFYRDGSGFFRPTTIFISSTGALSCGTFGHGTVTLVGPAFSAASVLSYVQIRGFSYVYDAASRSIYEISGTSEYLITLTDVTATVTPLNFFTTNLILSVVASNNYLVAVGINKFFYSSTTTTLDFVASLVSGAGELSVNELKSTILWSRGVSNGFYLFGADAGLFAQYTGNSRYPWKLSPIKNFAGLSGDIRYLSRKVYGDASSEGLYLIEKNLQLKYLTGDNAAAVAPEATDFLFKTRAQSLFNYATNTFTEQFKYTNEPTIYVWMNRYIFISINDSPPTSAEVDIYTHALVYDILLQRYGKLKVPHSLTFCGDIFKDYSGIQALRAVGFVSRFAGTIKFLNPSVDQVQTATTTITLAPAEGVLVLGKFQYVRSRKIQLHEIQVEGPVNSALGTAANFSCVLLPSLNGRTFDAPVTPYQVSNAGGLAVYNCHATAQNHSIVLKGAFNLSTVQLKFSPRGDA